MNNRELELFAELTADLEQKSEAIDELEKSNEVSFHQLFNETFMNKYTDFDSLEEMFAASPFDIENKNDFTTIDKEELDNFINDKTVFLNWEDMLDKAGELWTANKLGI
ncbi:hypothetical protein [Halanaerobacter jeridensis]|uniref:Uncharacterized protein n=1 Tax=Halanaerobacter jeridensis TaxID=706427 RepID=A0A938XRY5_9FIRM|nr:hypothetical protein [Halanaerobacter jeridensis]MBM7556375.1 hypothetical protein [Halanaerobacter jeridensis]